MRINKIKKNSSRTNRKGFALILVLLFTAISLMVVSTIALSLVNDARLSRQSKVLNQTYGLARTAIGESWNKYQDKLTVSTTADGDKNYITPTNGCISTYKYVDPETRTESTTLPSSNQRYKGWYGYRVCGSGNYIMGIGYYHGNQLTLRAKITHDDSYTVSYNTPSVDINSAIISVPGTCSSVAGDDCWPSNATNFDFAWDHSKDKLKIFQTN